MEHEIASPHSSPKNHSAESERLGILEALMSKMFYGVSLGLTCASLVSMYLRFEQRSQSREIANSIREQELLLRNSESKLRRQSHRLQRQVQELKRQAQSAKDQQPSPFAKPTPINEIEVRLHP